MYLTSKGLPTFRGRCGGHQLQCLTIAGISYSSLANHSCTESNNIRVVDDIFLVHIDVTWMPRRTTDAHGGEKEIIQRG